MRMSIVLALGAALALSLGTALASDHSGTVITVDPGKGTMILGEVGPWRLRDGQTVITRRTIAVGPSASFVGAKRSREPGPGGWPGEFVEVKLGAWAVKPGDFVTVRVDETGARWTATRVTVVDVTP